MHYLKKLMKAPICKIFKNLDRPTWNLCMLTGGESFLSPSYTGKSLIKYRCQSTDDIPKPLRNVKLKAVENKPHHFIDIKHVKVIAGNGGDGIISFLRLLMNDKAGPDGGDGGNGGHVIFKATTDQSGLYHIDKCIQADHGEKGSRRDCAGRNAQHKIINVPVGTMLRDQNGKVVADLDEEGMMYVAARGGAGGHGNAYFKSSTQQAPLICEYGAIGEQMEYTIEVKCMADFGLLGFPNAGKSTLLQAISRAKPKVASYPFTTMKPYLGVVCYDDYEQITVADLPGLIPDSHKNKGLGIAFLKHIERCAALLHVLDITLDEPWRQLEILKYEVSQFNDKLNERPLLVIANKMDLPGATENLELLKEKIQFPIIPISAKHGINVSKLLVEMRQIYDQIKCNSVKTK